MLAIDTNLLVRYLTNDHPTQSLQARILVDERPVFISVTVLLESDWVLRSTYGYQGPEVARALRVFAGLPTVTVEDGPIIANALDLAEQGMDFADALHVGRSLHCEGFVTFDRKLIRAAKSAGLKGVGRPG